MGIDFSDSTIRERRAMQRALELARLGEGRTAPNPPVGAVIVRDRQVVGEGHHARPGGPHGEVMALRDAGERARGATLFVTLEPCNHHGRTPPCTQAVIDAGISTVHVGVVDPNPHVAGHGIERLRAAGIRVVVGTESAAARAMIAPFAHLALRGRPHVTAKYAMTLDGRIATRSGDSRWVSGQASRRRAHSMRDGADAILVGAGTIIADDPSLTTRHPDIRRDPPPAHPLRVILDSHGRLSLSARVFDPSLPGDTMLATVDAPADHAAALADRGIEVLRLPDDGTGRVSLRALLDALGARGIMALLVEGGAGVLGAFFDQAMVQRCHVFIAPKMVGGAGAPGPIGGRGRARMDQAVGATDVTVERIGDDVLITAELETIGSDGAWAGSGTQAMERATARRSNAADGG